MFLLLFDRSFGSITVRLQTCTGIGSLLRFMKPLTKIYIGIFKGRIGKKEGVGIIRFLGF